MQLCAVRPVISDKLRPPSKHESPFRSFLQQRKAIFLVLQIAAVNQVNAGGFCLLLPKGCKVAVGFYCYFSLSHHCRDGMGLWGSIVVQDSVKGHFLCAFIPSCQNFLPAIHCWCHWCYFKSTSQTVIIVQLQWKTETNVWWLYMGEAKTPAVYLIWRVWEDIKHEKKRGKNTVP